MKIWHFLLVLVSILCFLFIQIFQLNTMPSFSFFPLDDQRSIIEASTSLNLLAEEETNTYEIEWDVASLSDSVLYLRQDVSLLFDNGRLLGVRSKWVQNTDRIQFTEKVTNEDSSYFQSISFHQGENHEATGGIKSVQRMTYDTLYVIDSPTTPIASFKNPEDKYETEWKELLDRTSKEQLLFHWHQLLHHFDIDINNYTAIPLVDLYYYENSPLPNLTMDETSNIIGRLWEGLYKNYVIPALDPPNDQLESYIPLILIDKQKTHLLVVFELNGKKEKLIQRIP